MRRRRVNPAWSAVEDLDLLEVLLSPKRRLGDLARFAREAGRSERDVLTRAAWLRRRRRPSFALEGVIIDDCPLSYAARARMLLAA